MSMCLVALERSPVFFRKSFYNLKRDDFSLFAKEHPRKAKRFASVIES